MSWRFQWRRVPAKQSGGGLPTSGHFATKCSAEPYTNPPIPLGYIMSTCIDTIEVYIHLSQHEVSYVASRLDIVTHAASDEPRNQFLSTNQADEEHNVLEYERFYRFVPGITRIKLLKYRMDWAIRRAQYGFKIFCWLKPELLVTGNYSLQLFSCSPENYHALQDVWASVIYELFPRAFEYAPLDPQLETYSDQLPPSGAYINQHLSCLPHLGLCQIERLDITKDIVVEDAARFEEIVRKSYQNNRLLKLKQQKKKTYLLADNGSKTFKAYDKRQELAEKHTRSPNLPEMLQEADGVIRIELSIKKPDRDTLKSLFGLTIPVAPKNAPAYLKCGLIPFFYETSDWGDRLMLKLWQQHIGTEPWLNRHYINKAIDNSRAWPETKKLAKEVTFVISRKRSLSEAREAYVQGVDIHGRHYKGSAEDFDKAVRFLRKIGVQPFRIPSRWKISRIEADFRFYPEVHIGFTHTVQNRPGIPSAPAEIYKFVKTKLIEIYKFYKPP